ncbi:MAG: SRPBCC family protein [Marmoricola sp.]
MTTTETTPLLEESIEVDASPETVWALISDLTRMPRWSPQVRKTWVQGGTTRQGARFRNLNRKGLLFWPTSAKVVAFVPNQKLAFRVRDNYTIWSFALEPHGTGTRITESREAPDGISDISGMLTKVMLGGQERFTEELRAGMRQTLTKIKDDLGG